MDKLNRLNKVWHDEPFPACSFFCKMAELEYAA